MQIVTPESADKEKMLEVARWASGQGPATPFVHELMMRSGMTFTAILLTREKSGNPHNN